MLINAPITREGELVDTLNIETLNHDGIFECPISLVFRNNDVRLSKSNDVGQTMPVKISQKAEMLVNPYHNIGR